ncbi:Uncharacterized protein Fot_32585 [Forsythia ovata]|uniref:Uncharacterized protein n=1 Tax=Forsythia ovata TaxID=205694 RepID=A0ABD1T8R7_9LAMI
MPQTLKVQAVNGVSSSPPPPSLTPSTGVLSPVLSIQSSDLTILPMTCSHQVNCRVLRLISYLEAQQCHRLDQLVAFTYLQDAQGQVMIELLSFLTLANYSRG